MSYSLDFGFPGSDVAWGELAGKVKDKLVSSARTRPKNDMESVSGSGQAYILLKDKEQAEKPTRVWVVPVPRSLHTSPCRVLKGELVAAIPVDERVSRNDGLNHNYRTLTKESPATFYHDDNELDLSPLTSKDYDVLASIKSAWARYQFFIEEGKLDWATRLRKGDRVMVELPMHGTGPGSDATASSDAPPGSGHKASAVIRYVGPLPGLPGVSFGVEIKDKDYLGWGSTDGTFQEQQYFACQRNHGLFVSVEKLFPLGQPAARGNQPQPSARGQPAGRGRESLHGEPNVDPQANGYRYKIGDRVVVFTRKGDAVHGTVKWVGLYSLSVDKKPQSFKAVGVETDVKVKKSEVEGLPEKHYVPAAKDKSVVYLIEDEVLSEAKCAEGRPPIPDLSLGMEMALREALDEGHGPEQVSVRAQAAAAGIATEMVTQDREARRELERKRQEDEEQKRQELAGIRQALPPGESLNISGQERRLQEFERDRQQMGGQPSQESMANRERPRVKQNQYETVGSKSHGVTLLPRRDHHHPGQQPLSDHHHHGALYNGSQHGVAPGTSQPLPHTQGSAGLPQQPPHTQGSPLPPPHTQESVWQSSHPLQTTPSPSVSQQTQPPDFPAAATQRSSPQPGRHVAYAGGPSQSPPVLEVGSAVWLVQNPTCHGVVRWLGSLPEVKGDIAGVALDVPMEGCGDGEWKGVRYFTSLPGRAFFCPVASLQPQPQTTPPVHHGTHKAENPLASIPLWEDADQTVQPDQILKYIGYEKGIQGHHNSCYLDATIFGLFALSDVFDSLFLDQMGSLTSLQTQTAASLQPQTPGTPTGLVQREIAEMLWKGIVNPLRKYGVVSLDSVMGLRNKLEELGKMEGVSTAEKDPEEFLNMLFKHTLHVTPFIHIVRPSGTEPEYFVQLFVEFEKNLKVPTIDKLLLKMFREMKISFAEVPSKLLVQVPRYGKQFQTYKRIVPGIKLDTTPFLENHNSSECFLCGELAQVKCPECGMDDDFKPKEVFFCSQCNGLVHRKRVSHRPEPIQGEDEAVELELLSVLCIETSHYVCFSRDSDGRWLFFDSMADRVYDQFNIPRGVDCTDKLNEWVYEGDQEQLMAAGPRELPELVRRFTQDVYMCVYIQADYGMYG